jgi:hypothetical protein
MTSTETATGSPAMCKADAARHVLAGVAIVAALIVWPAVATAELRTGSHGNPYPDDPPTASPTTPKFDWVAIQYDDAAGSIVATVRFATPLADPAYTSALRPWSYSITLGDYFSTICVGTDRTWLRIYGRLGDAEPAELHNVGDFENATPDLIVAETFSADRSEITLTVTDPSLVGLNLICADAEVEKDDDEHFKYGSSSFGFLLDGFGRLDGEIEREAEYSMRDNIEFLDRDWGRKPTQPRRTLALAIKCRRTVLRDRVACKATGRLRSVPGRPRIRLRGRLEFPDPFRHAFAGPRWRYAVRGDVRWKRCPRAVQPPSRLIGKPCSIRIRWRDTRDLSHAVLR